MRIEQDIKLDYKDVLIRPKRSILGSRKEVNLDRKFTYRNYNPPFPDNSTEYHYSGIPIIASNMDGVGTMEMADTLAQQNILTCLVKTYSEDELVNYFNGDVLVNNSRVERTEYVAMSIGITDHDYSKFKEVYDQVKDNLKYVCVDVANGYSERFATFVRGLRNNYPHIVIIAGNVVTGEMTEELILAGADIVKVGIGPGSVCTTRIQNWCGVSATIGGYRMCRCSTWPRWSYYR